MPEGQMRNTKGLKYLKKGLKDSSNLVDDYEEEDDDDDDGPEGYKILVLKNKNYINTKKFEFEVVDSKGENIRIKRNLTDMIWLRNNLRKDFPYSYVRKKK